MSLDSIFQAKRVAPTHEDLSRASDSLAAKKPVVELKLFLSHARIKYHIILQYSQYLSSLSSSVKDTLPTSEQQKFAKPTTSHTYTVIHINQSPSLHHTARPEHTSSPTQQSAHRHHFQTVMSDNKAIINSRPVQKPICIYAGVIGTISSLGVAIHPTASIATLLDCLQRQLIRRSLPHEFTAYTTKRGNRWMTSDEHWSIIYNSSAIKAKYICPWAKLDPTLTVGDYFVDPPFDARHVILEWTAVSLAQREAQLARSAEMLRAFQPHKSRMKYSEFKVEWQRQQLKAMRRRQPAAVVSSTDVVVATRRAATLLLGHKIDKYE